MLYFDRPSQSEEPGLGLRTHWLCYTHPISYQNVSFMKAGPAFLVINEFPTPGRKSGTQRMTSKSSIPMKGKTAQYDHSLLPILSQQMKTCGLRHDLQRKNMVFGVGDIWILSHMGYLLTMWRTLLHLEAAIFYSDSEMMAKATDRSSSLGMERSNREENKQPEEKLQ